MFQKIIVAYVYLLSIRGRFMCNVLLVDSFLNASSFPSNLLDYMYELFPEQAIPNGSKWSGQTTAVSKMDN